METRIDLPDDVAKALAAIAERSRAEEVILFGSRARGDHHEWSDWDIALILPDDAGPDRLQPSRFSDLTSGTGIELHTMRRGTFERKKVWPGSIARWADHGIRLTIGSGEMAARAGSKDGSRPPVGTRTRRACC